MSIRACALGIREAELSPATRAVVRAIKPWGLILFKEACVDPDQVRALCGALREAAGHDAVIWIDQEGGRVARLRPPVWPAFPAGMAYSKLYAVNQTDGLEAAWLAHRLIAHELKGIGVDGDFAPVLDIPAQGADPIIGDRAFGADPETVAALGAAALSGLRAGGVAGCIKHIPGHGRADADSHIALPRVGAGRAELGVDFAPFKALREAEAAMTAHVVYSALDPERPATHSPAVIDIIRNEIGFSGLLMSDDVDMAALSGPLDTRAALAFAAGCDLILQCNGRGEDMELAAAGCPPLEGAALARARRVEAVAKAAGEPFDAAHGWRRLRALMGPAMKGE